MKIQPMVTAVHMLDGLGSGMYTRSQAGMELLRNGVVACMPNGKWEPQKAYIEIMLALNHPLSPEKKIPVLIFLDRGCGITDPALDRYFGQVGPSLTQLRKTGESSNGASQKGIGRLAAFALNEKCLERENRDLLERVKHGYYLFSRTSKTGKVRYVSVIPEKIEEGGGFEIDRFIDPGATELGPLKNIQGTFTAIVIPTPVFESAEEIYEAIKDSLPRERDKMFNLTIGGKQCLPPPLEEQLNITSKDGRFRARLGVDQTSKDGVWLCDEETSLRVESCQRMGSKFLPEPLYFPELVGEIFAPGLLRHQNTARSGLKSEYTRRGNKEWQKLVMFLIGDVAPNAKKLVERDVISGNAAETLDEVVGLFRDQFGPPEGVRPPSEKRKKPVNPRPDRKDDDEDDEKPDPKRRCLAIKVLDETYHLYRGQSLEPEVFAQPSPQNEKMIFVSVRGAYKAMPENKSARREHCLMQILMTIGSTKSDDPYTAIKFANQVRSMFNKK